MLGFPNPITAVIEASAVAAADMSMRSAGRTEWNEDDRTAMRRCRNRLVSALGEATAECAAETLGS